MLSFPTSDLSGTGDGLASSGASSDEPWAPPGAGGTCSQVRFLVTGHTYVCPASYLPGPAPVAVPTSMREALLSRASAGPPGQQLLRVRRGHFGSGLALWLLEWLQG